MKCCCNKDDPKACGCRKAMPIILVILALLAGFGIHAMMTKPDQRTAAERIGDAVKQLPNGIDAASKQLEDKTPAQKMGEDLKNLVK